MGIIIWMFTSGLTVPPQETSSHSSLQLSNLVILEAVPEQCWRLLFDNNLRESWGSSVSNCCNLRGHLFKPHLRYKYSRSLRQTALT